MEYKGYEATVEFDDSIDVFHGRVVNCGAYPVATFEAADARNLRREFERSIDHYLAWCREDGVAPKQPAPASALGLKPALDDGRKGANHRGWLAVSEGASNRSPKDYLVLVRPLPR